MVLDDIGESEVCEVEKICFIYFRIMFSYPKQQLSPNMCLSRGYNGKRPIPGPSLQTIE